MQLIDIIVIEQKIFFIKKTIDQFFLLPKRTCEHLAFQETKNITHFPPLKTYSHQRYQCRFALWTTLQSSNFCQLWIFLLRFATLIFNSFSTKVCFRFHYWRFFLKKGAFQLNICTKKDTSKDKNIKISILK